jgi:hypothetical protein
VLILDLRTETLIKGVECLEVEYTGSSSEK